MICLIKVLLESGMQEQVLFSTEYGKVAQIDSKNKISISFLDYGFELNALCFFCLKKRVDEIEFPARFTDITPQSDWEIICPQGCERTLVFNLSQLARFKELLEGARVMMELNSILNERLRSPMPA